MHIFTAYEDFETFQRPLEMTIVEYINEFERLYNTIKVHKMELPTGVLAYRMLKSANISEEKQQLVRVTLVALTYEDMKKKLKAIHNSVSNENDDEKIKMSHPIGQKMIVLIMKVFIPTQLQI